MGTLNCGTTIVLAKKLEKLQHVFISRPNQAVFGKNDPLKVERVVLNALADASNALIPSCAFGDSLGIGPSRTGIFGEADPLKKERVIFNVLLRITTPLSLRILPADAALMTVG